jgi:hypothetical protein
MLDEVVVLFVVSSLLQCKVLSEAGPKEQKTGALSRELP